MRDQGTIFLETLIAAAIIAVTLGVTYQAIGDGTARTRLMESKREALLIAQSQLAAVGVTLPMTVGQSTGQEDDFSWKLNIEPYGQADAAGRAGALRQVTVSIQAPGDTEDLVTLRTVRIVPADEAETG